MPLGGGSNAAAATEAAMRITAVVAVLFLEVEGGVGAEQHTAGAGLEVPDSELDGESCGWGIVFNIVLVGVS